MKIVQTFLRNSVSKQSLDRILLFLANICLSVVSIENVEVLACFHVFLQ